MQQTSPEMLTIVIPTRNRSDFFLRLLPYYRDQGLKHRLIVADSSNPEFLSKTRRVFAGLGKDLNIDHRQYDEDVSYINKISDAQMFVDTPFSALGADDDFFVPCGLAKAVQFLKEHPHYSVAHGEAISLELRGGGVFGEIERVNRYDQRTIDGPEPAARLADHFSNYSTTYYSVHRTNDLCENLQKRVASKTDLAFGELLASALSMIQGKAKKLDGLFMVRQGFVAKEYEFTDAFDWVATPGWGEQYERFRDCLAQELNEQAGLEINEGRKVIKEVFVQYLTAVLKPPPATNATQGGTFRSAISAIPGVRPAVRALRSLDRSRRTDISLPALLNPSSPYHGDFMPIYTAITEPPEALRTLIDSD